MPRNKYLCDCPDYTKKQSFLINSPYQFHTENRDWSDSSAGVDGKTEFCKHIYAVKILRGELSKSDIPTDIPLEKNSEQLDIDTAEKYQQGYKGHDFSGGWGINQLKNFH